jgi:hypothetical protein
MDNQSTLVSKPISIITDKDNTNFDNDFTEILHKCGIRSRSSSQEDIILPASDSFLEEHSPKQNTESVKEFAYAESSDIPDIPFGNTPPDAHRFKQLYLQYISKVNNFDEKNK